jgi:predicted lipoprotein with Yx(FWY)xxD motif
MKRFLISVAAVVVVALVAAACGVATKTGTATVGTRQIQGVGKVLVDGSGLALYASDQETGGMVRCTGACNSFWRPVTVANGSPSATSITGTLGVVNRPDGTRQVTYNGKLLYSFSLDQPGKVHGDNFADAFDGQKFTWHVVHDVTTAGSSGGAQSAGGVTRTY